ncbi:MAG TPA: transposase, partial [Acholeplasmataceae bacterium]|nr:transposase [Acholeplasmataceae bacterium]
NSTVNYFKSVAATYKVWLNEIVNSFIINPKTNKRMSNGFIEGKNNYIKVIKRIGFGFKDFETFRAKILYTNSKNKLPYKY